MRIFRPKYVFSFGLILLILPHLLAAPCDYRIVYSQASVSLHKNAVIDQIGMAAKAGYNGFISPDWALENIEKQPSITDSYQQVLALAKQKQIELIPFHFANTMPTTEDWNLAEALPVKGTPFKVSGTTAKATGAPELQIPNGGFETGTNVPSGWKMGGSLPVFDSHHRYEGQRSLKYHNPTPGTYLKCLVKGLKPFRAYELSVWIRTQAYSERLLPRFKVMGGGTWLLNCRDIGFKPNGILPDMSNFTRHRTDFNSTFNTTVVVQLCPTVSGATGSIWVDDIGIREVGLYETVRRTSCPVTVRSKDGTRVYEEGKDYTVDPRCAQISQSSLFYEGTLAIPAGSAIQEGQELAVDWYQFADMDTRVPSADFCLPQTWSALQDNLDRIDKLFGNSDYMLTKGDEWRVGAWNEKCDAFKFSTGGEYLSRAQHRVECMLRNTGNGCRTVFAWNDMFDPYYNSQDPFWLFKGGTRGSWAGLGSETIIVNWNSIRPEESLTFFKGKDPKFPNAVSCRQVVLVPDALGAVPQWLEAIKKAEAKGGLPIVGMVWANWAGDASGMEPIARAFQTAGWWGTNPLPRKTCAPLSDCLGFQPGIARSDRKSKQGEDFFLSARTHALDRSVVVEYILPRSCQLELSVYDIRGRRIRNLVSNRLPQGRHQITWNNEGIPVGVYFLRLQAGDSGVRGTRLLL